MKKLNKNWQRCPVFQANYNWDRNNQETSDGPRLAGTSSWKIVKCHWPKRKTLPWNYVQVFWSTYVINKLMTINIERRTIKRHYGTLPSSPSFGRSLPFWDQIFSYMTDWYPLQLILVWNVVSCLWPKYFKTVSGLSKEVVQADSSVIF